MSYYDKPHLTIRYRSETDTVVMQWHDFADGDPYREGLNAGIELVERKEATGWLADLRELGAVSDADKQWSNEK